MNIHETTEKSDKRNPLDRDKNKKPLQEDASLLAALQLPAY